MRRNEAPMLQQIYRLQPDSVGDKTGGYARTTPQKQATMQHEYYFKIVKECDDQFCKKEENKAINSKNNVTNEHLHLRISLENFQRS